MNIKRLEQYSFIKKEIRQLEKQIINLKSKEDRFLSDTVSGSSVNFPYIKQNYTITGINGKHNIAKNIKINKIMRRIDERKTRLDNELEEIEEFIDTVDDSEIRQIIQYKYIEGLSWLVTSRKIYGYPCGDRARMRITRFFAEI